MHDPDCIDVMDQRFDEHHWCDVGDGFECCANCGQLRLSATPTEVPT